MHLHHRHPSEIPPAWELPAHSLRKGFILRTEPDENQTFRSGKNKKSTGNPPRWSRNTNIPQ